MIWKLALQILLFVLPWPLRRRLLNRLFKFEIAPTAHIGISIVMPEALKMAPGSRIGHLNFCRALSLLDLSTQAVVAHMNWISATSKNSSGHFELDPGRYPALIVGPYSVITNSHRLDCCDTIKVGAFTTVAGWSSQIITHGIDIVANRQRTGAIEIGNYCFVGSRVILLKNSRLPDCSVLAAGSVLNKVHTEPYGLYSGNPAVRTKDLDKTSAYFRRTERDVI